jgi:hypothetical protein
VRIELLFERNTAHLSGISSGESFNPFKICLYRRMEETHTSLGRKPSLLEAGKCSTLFPCEN